MQLKVKVNGRSALMIVDTGASRTVFDRAELQKYLKSEEISGHDRLSTGLGTSEMQSEIVTLGSLSLGKMKLQKFDAVVLNLQHVNQTYAAIGFAPIVGVLGSDVLVAQNAVIDFRKKSLILTMPKKSPKIIRKKKPLPGRKKAKR